MRTAKKKRFQDVITKPTTNKYWPTNLSETEHCQFEKKTDPGEIRTYNLCCPSNIRYLHGVGRECIEVLIHWESRYKCNKLLTPKKLRDWNEYKIEKKTRWIKIKTLKVYVAWLVNNLAMKKHVFSRINNKSEKWSPIIVKSSEPLFDVFLPLKTKAYTLK